MATIKDVANKANVSKMTVSRVINTPEKVSPELRELVFQAMDELQYQPNQIAKALASKKTHVVKIFVSSELIDHAAYIFFVVTGLSKRLASLGYTIILTDEIVLSDRDSDYTIVLANTASFQDYDQDSPLLLLDVDFITMINSLLEDINQNDNTEKRLFIDRLVSERQNSFRNKLINEINRIKNSNIGYKVSLDSNNTDLEAVNLKKEVFINSDAYLELGAIIAEALLK